MNRAIAAFLLVVITFLFIVMYAWNGKAVGGEEPSLSDVISRQQMILERLDAMDKKLDDLKKEIARLKMRARR